MGFNKADNEQQFTVNVLHELHAGKVFAFTFPKRLPQSALDAQKAYFGATEKEREQDESERLIATVAAMLAREPEGFDDFPRDERPLPERITEYFTDDEHPELEAIIKAAWRRYWEAVVPTAYLKSPENNLPPVGSSTEISE